ncbi:hypothetical protein [Pseudoxanthomonas mexicana]
MSIMKRMIRAFGEGLIESVPLFFEPLIIAWRRGKQWIARNRR